MNYIILLLAMVLAACKVGSVAICTFSFVGNIVAYPIEVTKFTYTWLRVFVPTLLTEVSVAVYYDKCYISPCKC
jgi:hypothetical protein